MSLSKQIARIVAETAVFLEFSDEKIVEPDSAVSLMETIATLLRELSRWL